MLEPDDLTLHERDCRQRCEFFYDSYADEDACFMHDDHVCDCATLAADRAERDAQAFVDWQQATFEVWERNNG